MNIAQLQFSFDAAQDRLLFRVNGADGAEMRVWFTRRLVKLLWPNLQKTLAHRMAQDVPAATTDANAMLVGMKHQEHVAKMDFATPYREPTQMVSTAAEPLLINRMDLTPQANGITRMLLQAVSGARIDMNLNDTLMHAFCSMLQQCCTQADWDVELPMAGFATEQSTEISRHSLN